MEELEAVHRESSRRLDCPASSDILPQLLQTAKKDKDAVEAQRRTFDDLEFSLLEVRYYYYLLTLRSGAIIIFLT